MRRVVLIVLLTILYSMAAQAQVHSCCVAPASAKFAAMATNAGFIRAHASPLPFRYESIKGKMIKFKTSGGPDANAFEIKSDKPTNKVVLLFHEWWGLNDYIKQEAEKLQNELGDVTVVAVDMFDGKVTANPAQAGQYVKMLTDARAQAIIAGAVQYAGPRSKIATIGWCFGGGISLQATIAAEKQGVACVMYYGMPETNKEKLKKIHASVLGIFGTKDKFITQDLVSAFAKDMASVGKVVAIKNYDADHAFANPSNPHHDAVAAADAHTLAVAFLRKKLM